jgi:hypothetical protein
MVIFSAIASVFTAIGFSVATAGFLANTIVTLGLSLLQSRLSRPEKTTRTAVEGDLELGADVFSSVVYGKAKLEGQLLHYNKYGSGNSHNQFVFVLSNGWCDGLEPHVIINDKKHDLVELPVVNNETARYRIDGYSDNIIIRFYDGRPGQTADPELVTHANPSDNWTTDHKVAGHAYVSVTHRYSQALYPSGIPKLEFILRGLRCYDFRKDSTVGGSGSHRIDDPATWEFTENPVIHRFNHEIGLRGLHSGKVMIGMGKSLAETDLATYTFSANAADAERVADGVTVKTYIAGSRAFSNRTHRSFLDMMDGAIAGYGVERGGLSGVIAGAIQIPGGELLESDIRLDEKFAPQPRRSRAERFNQLSGIYKNPDALWENDSYTPVISDAAVAIDKRELPSTLDLPQIPGAAQAQLVADIRFRQNRYMAQINRIPVTFRAAIRWEVGDWLNFRGKTWLVTKVGADARLNGYISLAETSADIFDPEGLLNPPQTIPPTSPGSAPVTTTVAGLTIANITISEPI